MNATKNDPKLGRSFGSAEQIIAWLGRQDVNRTFGDDFEIDIEEIRFLLAESDE